MIRQLHDSEAMPRLGRPYELTVNGIVADADGFRGCELEMRKWAKGVARSHIDQTVVGWDEYLNQIAYRVIARSTGTFWANGPSSQRVR